ncbi:MAG: hypothetical protein ACRDRE_12250 [Pseudonocardiaceae bacterium]
MTLVASFLNRSDARTPGDQFDGELANIYGGLPTGHEVTGCTQTDRQ